MRHPRVADVVPAIVELEPGKHHYCSCGLSARQPFCDGSHRETGFRPLTFLVTAARRMALCQCKYTREAPRCDGSHRLYEKEER